MFERNLRVHVSTGMFFAALFFLVQPIAFGWYEPTGNYSRLASSTPLFIMFMIIYYSLVILNITGYVRVLLKKTNNPRWMLLSLAFMPAILVPALMIIGVVDRDTHQAWMIPAILIVLAWLALSFLELYTEDLSLSKKSIGGRKASGIVTGSLFLLSAVTLISTLTLSFFYSRSATTIFQHAIINGQNAASFSFDYPVSFSRTGMYFGPVSSPKLKQEYGWFRAPVWTGKPMTYLSIGYVPVVKTEETSLLDYIYHEPTKHSPDGFLLSPFGGMGFDSHQTFFQTTIDGRPALYTTVHRDPPPDEDYILGYCQPVPLRSIRLFLGNRTP